MQARGMGRPQGPTSHLPASHILNFPGHFLHTAQATASCLQTSGAVGMLVLGVLLSTEGARAGRVQDRPPG